MDDDFTPVGGESLRGRVLHAGQQVATFTPAEVPHPDDIWHPLGGELDQSRPQRALAPRQDRKTGHAKHPHAETARMVRSALRPGG
jgi:hypothetical protein